MFPLVLFAVYTSVCLCWFPQLFVYTGILLFFIGLLTMLYQRKLRKNSRGIDLGCHCANRLDFIYFANKGLIHDRLAKAAPPPRLADRNMTCW
jgi:hypothetical protein